MHSRWPRDCVYTGSNIETRRIMISWDMTGRYGWNIFENFDYDSTKEIGISEFLVLWSSFWVNSCVVIYNLYQLPRVYNSFNHHVFNFFACILAHCVQKAAHFTRTTSSSHHLLCLQIFHVNIGQPQIHRKVSLQPVTHLTEAIT